MEGRCGCRRKRKPLSRGKASHAFVMKTCGGGFTGTVEGAEVLRGAVEGAVEALAGVGAAAAEGAAMAVAAAAKAAAVAAGFDNLILFCCPFSNPFLVFFNPRF